MEHSNLIDKLREKNLLTIVDGKVAVKPHDQYSFTTYPLVEDDYILITVDEYLGMFMRVYMFNDELNGVVDFVPPVFEEQE